MSALLDVDDAIGVKYRFRTLIIFGKFCLGKNKVESGQNFLILFQISAATGGLGAEQLQDFFDFGLFLHIQFF